MKIRTPSAGVLVALGLLTLGVMPMLAASPAPSAVPILPGEPWIVYDWLANPGHTNGLYAVRPDGTDDQLILPAFSDPSGSAEWGREGALHPDWSPDGSRIAFTRGADESWTIWVADVDGSDAHQVVPCAAPCQVVDLAAWSPDGTRLSYSRWTGEWPPDRYSSASAIEILDLTTGETRTVLESTAQPPQNPEIYVGPRWSPDGTSLVLAIQHFPEAQISNMAMSDAAIAILDVSGDGPATPRVITDPAMFAGSPDWSPSGDLIVFDTYGLGNFGISKTTDLHTIRPDGTELTQLTDNAGKDEWATFPTWTPDGSQIIFTHIGRTPSGGLNPDSFQVAFMNPDGTGLRILDGGYKARPRLRPTP